MKSDLNSATSNSAQLLASVELLKRGLAGGGDAVLQPEPALRRQQLQAALQALLLADLEFALDHKAEQELWTTCFKSQIALLQARAKDKKLGNEQKEWQANLQLFLDSALGFYTMLLNQLCQTYDIDLPCRRKDALLSGFFGYEREKRSEGATTPNHSSCCYVVQDCLVHMGDLARYRGKVKQAESCYRHAVKLLPSSGQPYNQLALLEAQHGDGISAVYYYVRSVAVRQPFPAATTNLAKLFTRLAANGTPPEIRPRLTATSYTALFLQLHARLQHRCQPHTLRPLQTALAAQLPRLLLSNSLSTWRLLQMLTITVQAAHAAAGRPDGSGVLEPPAAASAPDQRALSAALEMAATTLDALLRTAYRLQSAQARRQWPALPVVRLYVSWLSEAPAALTLEPLSTRPQLWAHLCHLVNGLEVSAETLTHTAENRLPLPEDVDLAGFLPLSGCQRGLKLSRSPVPESEQAAVRAARLRLACERLARHGVVWSSGPAGSLQSGYSADEALVLQQLSQAEAEGAADSLTPPSPDSSVPSTPEAAPLDGVPAPPPRAMGTAARSDSKTGILKSEAGPAGRRRQNVALQAIMKSGGVRTTPPAEEARSKDARQVTFRTPSPTPVPSPPLAAPPQSQQQPMQQLPRPQQQQLPPRYLQQQLLQQQARSARAGGDSWRQSATAAPLASPPSAVWPPPRPPHPLEESPAPGQGQGLQFNPLVPPPGWASGGGGALGQGWPPQPGRAPLQPPESRARPAAAAAPFDALKQSLWSGWPMTPAAAAPVHRQTNPLAAILSQCRAPASALAQETPRPRDSLGVYSLFPSAPAQEAPPRAAAYSLFPSSSMQQQSMWPSAGPSPLERLIEQQRQQSGHGKP